ncbi:putative alpha/beta-hydrolase family hydrolase [Tahibacter aquaticus]|uniref:Putative alpha/beta-hydrolase family hydrolase n=1 Tax=Tahibacter aquaticus TaxID=520092 RepID=A0A4R6YMR5_9GAMM|nr:alpha/beta hydrolase [Tahibacter aquaticus]TDR38740.1 putative alpha/beta-hydrolase family hydrolase [Tahibacter aquaticus]
MKGHVILSHGSDSGPGGTKVAALAVVAKACGWRASCADYRDLDARGMLACIDPRVARLRQMIRADEPTVLVGSSMGAFVSGLASLDSPVAGLFLMALPLAIPGYARAFGATRVATAIVHGWDDEICPASEVVAYAQQRRASLLMLSDAHRLAGHVELIAEHFRLFLAAIEAEPDLAALAEVEE